MFRDKQIEIAKYLTGAGLVPKVYHSVYMLKDDTNIFAAYNQGDEFYYVGADDRKSRFGYIRRIGEGSVKSIQTISSCSKSYLLSVPFRFVVFNSFEKSDKQELLRKILGFTFREGVFLKSFQDNVFEVAKSESLKMDYNFGGNTLFVSIDFTIIDLITSESCLMDCKVYPNPITNTVIKK